MNTLQRWRDALCARLIDDWKAAWRKGSVLVAGASGLILEIWNTLPDDMRSQLPPWMLHAAPMLMVAAVFLARIMKKAPTDAAA